MPISLQTEVRMVKGVGPQRAELLAKRGIHTLEDLLNYLPFRYEDRIHFSRIKDVQPGGTYTLRARVMTDLKCAAVFPTGSSWIAGMRLPERGAP